MPASKFRGDVKYYSVFFLVSGWRKEKSDYRCRVFAPMYAAAVNALSNTLAFTIATRVSGRTLAVLFSCLPMPLVCYRALRCPITIAVMYWYMDNWQTLYSVAKLKSIPPYFPNIPISAVVVLICYFSPVLFSLLSRNCPAAQSAWLHFSLLRYMHSTRLRSEPRCFGFSQPCQLSRILFYSPYPTLPYFHLVLAYVCSVWSYYSKKIGAKHFLAAALH